MTPEGDWCIFGCSLMSDQSMEQEARLLVHGECSDETQFMAFIDGRVDAPEMISFPVAEVECRHDRLEVMPREGAADLTTGGRRRKASHR